MFSSCCRIRNSRLPARCLNFKFSTYYSFSTLSRSSKPGWINVFPLKAVVCCNSTKSHHHHHKPIQREKPKDLYSILEVSPYATQQQVKDAYYKLSMKYHPDRNKGSIEAHHKFTDLTEAYSILGQYELRKKYDKGLLHQYPRRPTVAQQPASSQAQRSPHFVDKNKVKFDFDEFYKAHYGDALKRQRDNKRQDEEAKVRASYYSVSEPVQQLMIIGVTLAVLGLGLYFFPTSQEQLKLLKNKSTGSGTL